MSQRDNPFSEIEQLFDDLTDFGAGSVRGTPVDIVDEEDAFVAVVDLPGFSAADIEVQLEDERTLSIHADRDDYETVEEGNYVRRERRQETVDRSVTLPGVVDPDQTEAKYDNGVLTVRLGKETGEGEGTNIEVN
jgi:HSP20 family protein